MSEVVAARPDAGQASAHESVAKVEAGDAFTRLLLDSTSEAFYAVDRDGATTLCNRAFVEMLGFESREQVIGRTLHALIHHSHRDGTPYPVEECPIYRAAAQGQAAFVRDETFFKLDGTAFLVEYRAEPIMRDGMAAGAICTFTDVTERRAAEAALIEREHRLRLVVDGATDYAFITIDPERRITSWSHGAEVILGYAPDEALGMPLDALFTPEDVAAGRPLAETQIARRDGCLDDERWHRCKDGGRVFLSGTLRPLGPDAMGREQGFIKIARDETERRRAASALQATTQRAESLATEQATILGQLAEGVIVADRAGSITFVNAAAHRIHGAARCDLGAGSYADNYLLLTTEGAPYPPDRLPLARAVVNRETVLDARWRIRRVDGSEVLAVGGACPLLDGAGELLGAVLTLRDDTERDAAERSLRTSRDQLADESHALEILNRTGALVAAELDLERLVQRVVDAGVELTGAQFGAFFYTVQDASGGRLRLYALSGADRAAFESFGMPRSTPLLAPTLEGLGVIRSADILTDPRYGRNAPHAGMPTGHLPVRSYLAVPVISRSGEVIGGLFFGHAKPDVFSERSERVMSGLAAQAAIGIDNARLFDAVQKANAELEARVRARTLALEEAHEALRQSQKMEAVGQLTGGIAHDFNNMLAVVIGSLDLLTRRLDASDARARRYVDAASDGARRAALLTQRLLAFARQQPLRPEAVDVDALVAGMSDLIRGSLGSDIRFETVLGGGGGRAHADPNQLENVLLNLAVNARDAMADGGRLTMETRNVALGDAAGMTHAGVQAGEYVAIAVTDTGSGMPEEVIAKAFDPFFTTKAVGKGTGLGLSQVYGYVKQSGGHVQIESEPGRGTTVTVFLPRLPDGAAVDDGSTAAPAPAAARGSGEVVLVVEDEAAVRSFSVEALGELGYRVIEADSAVEALNLLDAHPEIALLFTDVVMPDVNGRKLVEEARRRRPGLRMLLTSGYTRDEIGREAAAGSEIELLAKPFTIEALEAKVRTVLDQPPR